MRNFILKKKLVENRFAVIKNAWYELQGKHNDYMLTIMDDEDEEIRKAQKTNG